MLKYVLIIFVFLFLFSCNNAEKNIKENKANFKKEVLESSNLGGGNGIPKTEKGQRK